MVRVEFRKWDGSLHWHFAMEHLGDDEHGTWLGGPPGTILQRGAGPPIVRHDPFVVLVPANGSWVASWLSQGAVELYVDVTSAPEWEQGTVTTVDLDLDVLRRRDGTTTLVDEDEFADHQLRFGYPLDVVEAAERTATWLMEAVGVRVEPFDQAGPRWLAAV